ncbi:MAG: ATP-dependent helicase [Phycisphaerae bacterium]
MSLSPAEKEACGHAIAPPALYAAPGVETTQSREESTEVGLDSDFRSPRTGSPRTWTHAGRCSIQGLMLCEDLLEGLTTPQREAVGHAGGPLLVLAGAGSGKTRVITRRAARLARTVARPSEVLAITFTNKAAGEMRERIYALGVGGGMWVCTFHSLCARLLRQYGSRLGIDRNFSIFDQSDSRALVRRAIVDCDLHTDNWQPRGVLADISKAKSSLQSPEEYESEAADYRSRTVARIYAQYQRLLREQNACDFDDLLMRVALMLGDHGDIRAELSDRFRHLLIDEYQDTNRAQYLIAARLAEAHRNICATGDPDQSIYAWRGADIRNILDFERDYPEARVVRLERNYRSTGAILAAASSLISKNTRRKRKKLFTEDEWGTAVRVWTCEDEHIEAEKIAEDIQAHCEGGGAPGDAAVFYRINALTRVIEDALRKARIPYQIARGVEFYARKEIKDVLAYLRIITNPADETAMLRAVNTPARGIGKITLQRLQRHARGHDITLDAAISAAGEIAAVKTAHRKLRAFGDLIRGLRALPERPVWRVVEAVLERSGLEESLAAAGEIDNEPLENVYELVTAAREYDQENPEGSLGEWLHQISLVSDVDAIELSGGAVTLMTLHAAKGLEFPRVYMIGLEEDLLPHRRSISENPADVEEERRLCFVGMTRAQRCLTLSRAKYRMVRGVTERTAPSRFLSELPADEIERTTFEAERDRSRAHLRRANDADFAVEDALYFPGQRVRHEDYGVGRVMGLERRGRSTFIRIDFSEDGPRSFALEHVSLYIMDA